MAITQISVIQVRRGLQADLATLASGEFGWAIDTQRLYIGNGTIDEGAPFEGMTEIMTYAIDFSETWGNYTYEGVLGGYEVNTGATLATRVIRRIQDKIDDIVNVRDFGASGNGIIDDSPAIQRAIDELYDRQNINTRKRTRRVLRFNAGTYRISEPLKLPPYFQLWGEGKESVTIRADGDFEALTFRTSTGGAVDDPDHATSQPPFGITITGMTFATGADNHVATIDSAKDILFENVGFVGFDDDPADSTLGKCVVINSSSYTTQNIIFRNCTFKFAKFGIEINSNIGTENIIVENSQFENLYSGIKINHTGDEKPNHVKLSNNKFTNILNSAVSSDPTVSNIISLANSYINIGNIDFDDESPAFAVLSLPGSNNYSIGDYFSRPGKFDRTFPRVFADRNNVFVTTIDDALRFGDSYTTAGKTISMPENHIQTLILPTRDHGVINYRIRRGDENRVGRLKFSALASADDPNPTTTVIIDDEYVETTDIGISLTVKRESGNLVLEYTSSPTGGQSFITYNLQTYTDYYN